MCSCRGPTCFLLAPMIFQIWAFSYRLNHLKNAWDFTARQCTDYLTQWSSDRKMITHHWQKHIPLVEERKKKNNNKTHPIWAFTMYRKGRPIWPGQIPSWYLRTRSVTLTASRWTNGFHYILLSSLSEKFHPLIKTLWSYFIISRNYSFSSGQI